MIGCLLEGIDFCIEKHELEMPEVPSWQPEGSILDPWAPILVTRAWGHLLGHLWIQTWILTIFVEFGNPLGIILAAVWTKFVIFDIKIGDVIKHMFSKRF